RCRQLGMVRQRQAQVARRQATESRAVDSLLDAGFIRRLAQRQAAGRGKDGRSHGTQVKSIAETFLQGVSLNWQANCFASLGLFWHSAKNRFLIAQTVTIRPSQAASRPKITIREVAREAGVSLGTASRAMNRAGR